MGRPSFAAWCLLGALGGATSGVMTTSAGAQQASAGATATTRTAAVDTMRPRILEAARVIIGTARYATLSTVQARGRGQPQSRMVDPALPDSTMTVLVATNPRSRKVQEIRANPRVALLYFDSAAGEYVTLQGIATLITAPAEKVRLWDAKWTPFYPQGATSPSVMLLRIRPEQLEIVSPRYGLTSDTVTWKPVTLPLVTRSPVTPPRAYRR
ncbi:MAG: pyridoxamine 5'-phosphate oxidase family protein [Gemmatimonadaceae bacterium]